RRQRRRGHHVVVTNRPARTGRVSNRGASHCTADAIQNRHLGIAGTAVAAEPRLFGVTADYSDRLDRLGQRQNLVVVFQEDDGRTRRLAGQGPVLGTAVGGRGGALI